MTNMHVTKINQKILS